MLYPRTAILALLFAALASSMAFLSAPAIAAPLPNESGDQAVAFVYDNAPAASTALGFIYDGYLLLGASTTVSISDLAVAPNPGLVPKSRYTHDPSSDSVATNAIELPEALTVGRNAEQGVSVYQGVIDGKPAYVGITNDIARRAIEHGDRFVLDELAAGLTRGEARAVEQAIIAQNPGYQNLINSISPSHPWYQQAVDWGEAFLRANGLG